MITSKPFGTLRDGRSVTLYEISNDLGESVELLDFGASIHALNVRDAHGKIDDIVLGVVDAEELGSFTTEGTTIGRCANRVAFGRFEIGGRTVQLEIDESGHSLHSVSGNYAYRFFHSEINENASVVSFYLHENGEGGFGCAADAWVHYQFTNDHRLEIYYEITPEDDTIINPTNHAFFNLAGASDARDHVLQVLASKYTPKGDIGMPVGDIKNVKNMPMDFTVKRPIRDAMEKDPELFFGNRPPKYDDSFIFDKDGFGLAAKLENPMNGRQMRIYTDMPAMVFFTPTFPLPGKGKKDKAHQGYSSICLETGFVPNAVNCPQYDSPIVYKGQTFISRTTFEFGTQ